MSSRPSANDPERLTLRPADQARADLYAIAGELKFLKVQFAPASARARAGADRAGNHCGGVAARVPVPESPIPRSKHTICPRAGSNGS
jgi:hypothetical protein